MFPIFEYLLVTWIDAAEAARQPITDEAIRAQGKRIQERLSSSSADECRETYDSFEMSSGWLQGFKQRHNIDQHKRHRQVGGPFDAAAIPTHRASLSMGLRQFAPADRYNCDEARLHFDRQPELPGSGSGSGSGSGVEAQGAGGAGGEEGGGGGAGGGEKDKEKEKEKGRFTVFLCVNADGTDKRRITVMSKIRTPAVFKRERINPANLPVTYRYNKKTSLPTDLWYEFLRTFDADMRDARRRIALVCENCPTYPTPTKPPPNYKGPPPPVLTNITLFFLPTNTAALLQPLSQGIITAFKATYRKMCAELLLDHHHHHHSHHAARRERERINTLEAIDIITSAWSAIPPRIILQCWQAAAICEDLALMDLGGSPAEYVEAQRRACLGVLQRLQPRQELAGALLEAFWGAEEEIPGCEGGEAGAPDVVRIVDECVAAGILRRGVEGMELQDGEEEEGEEEGVGGGYLAEVNRYLRSLPVSVLKTPMGKEVAVSEAISSNMLVMAGIPQQFRKRKAESMAGGLGGENGANGSGGGGGGSGGVADTGADIAVYTSRFL
ncbi:DDE-domain-containing protein [Morchella conica CCBAS932]|uniref:DDE-domain-containing protein n=1 Tax=Morchella conica CCBAS932 TaxID=1392247 RepID=A0A3N4KH91_9PEZI|nr:DDE-domain-containing protein [Morchella conica CCBAS932]